MKQLLTTLYLIASVIAANAQTPDSNQVIPPDSVEKVFTVFDVDQMPVFPGAESGMLKFIDQTIVYPEKAKAAGVDGTVFISCTIGSTGKTRNCTVGRGLKGEEGLLLNNEAIRVVLAMPNWTPAKKAGKPVSMSYVVPVKFVIRN